MKYVTTHRNYKNRQTPRLKDHTLRNRLIIIFAVIFLILAGLWGIAIYGGQPVGYLGPETINYFKAGIDKIVAWGAGTSEDSIQNRVDDMYLVLNETRAEYGLYPLVKDPFLESLAQAHAKSLYERGVIDHEGFKDRANSAIGKGYNITGENVAGDVYEAGAFMELWMDSEGHRENILSSEFTHIGVGIYGKYAVQFFAGY